MSGEEAVVRMAGLGVKCGTRVARIQCRNGKKRTAHFARVLDLATMKVALNFPRSFLVP